MRFRHIFITLLVLLAPATRSVAVETEYQIKAAMLYNFAKFVEWPPDSFASNNHVTFCLVGKSPLNAPIQLMQGKLVKGRAVSIRQITRPNDVAGCQILFIPQSEYALMSVYLQQAKHYSILTVSDLEEFVSSGGMIGFYDADGNVRFEINLEAAQKRNLQISSYLLNLARRVQ
jgi:hypothetical protein